MLRTSPLQRTIFDAVINKRKVPSHIFIRSASSLPPHESREENSNFDKILKVHNDFLKQEQKQTRQVSKNEPREINLVSKAKLEPVDEFLYHKSPKEITFPGGVTLPITSKLKIVLPNEHPPQGLWPIFRLLDENGSFRINEYEIDSTQEMPGNSSKSTGQGQDSFSSNLLTKYADVPYIVNEIKQNHLLSSASTLNSSYRQMIRLRQMDTILQSAQRQGRISFYITCRGEESIHFGSASALTLKDTIFAQYREAGILMWRGFSLEQFTDQCFSNSRDLGRGRQMPVHYGSRALNYHTISSPLGTQIIHAVGAGYKMKIEAQQKQQTLDGCSVVYFGDGAASTSDFHAACNFAATLECPVIFICRNNGFAISTPVHEQYRGDGIISRASGYGMAGCRVDGNDIFAMNAAIREAKHYALKHCKPILVEVMTYRQSHHSTSDDSTRYRNEKYIEEWATIYDPVKRLHRFMYKEGLIDDDERAQIKDEERLAVLRAMEKAEKTAKPDLSSMFQDVYKDIPSHLQKQETDLHDHLKKYGEHY